MKTKATLFIIFTVMLFAFGVLITTLFNTAPTTKDAILMFYISGYLVLFGLLFYGQYIFRWLKDRSTPASLTITGMVRSSLIIDLFLLIILAFRAGGVLNLATAMVLIVAAFIVMLVTKKRLA